MLAALRVATSSLTLLRISAAAAPAQRWLAEMNEAHPCSLARLLARRLPSAPMSRWRAHQQICAFVSAFVCSFRGNT